MPHKLYPHHTSNNIQPSLTNNDHHPNISERNPSLVERIITDASCYETRLTENQHGSFYAERDDVCTMGPLKSPSHLSLTSNSSSSKTSVSAISGAKAIEPFTQHAPHPTWFNKLRQKLKSYLTTLQQIGLLIYFRLHPHRFQLGILPKHQYIVPQEQLQSQLETLYWAWPSEQEDLSSKPEGAAPFPRLFVDDMYRQSYTFLDTTCNPKALSQTPSTSKEPFPHLQHPLIWNAEQPTPANWALKKRLLHQLLLSYCQEDTHWLWEIGQLMNQRTVFDVLMQCKVQWRQTPVLLNPMLQQQTNLRYHWSIRPIPGQINGLEIELQQWWQPKQRHWLKAWLGLPHALGNVQLNTRFHSYKPGGSQRREHHQADNAVLQHVHAVDCRWIRAKHRSTL